MKPITDKTTWTATDDQASYLLLLNALFANERTSDEDAEEVER